MANSGGRHLAIEAGTGVGKSIAYLIPAVDLACRGAGKILISTFTITLQEQLINKDIPFLTESLPNKFTAVLAKGRGNYLCRRRLEFAMRRQRLLFSRFADELSMINDWAGQTEDGSLSDIGLPLSVAMTLRLKSGGISDIIINSSNCMLYKRLYGVQ